jgi:hypothetical protein
VDGALEKPRCFDVVWIGAASALYVCVEKGKGVLDLYDLVTVEHKHQKHEAVEVLKVVLALGGHKAPRSLNSISNLEQIHS